MLSKLNELTLQKELQNLKSNKQVKTQQQHNKKANIKILARARN